MLTRRGAVDLLQPRFQRRDDARLHHVGLGDENTVGDGGLFDRFELPVEGFLSIYGIDRRDHAVEAEIIGYELIRHQSVQDGRGISETRSLDQYPLEGRHILAQAQHHQVAQRVHQVTAYRAAQAAGIQKNHVLVAADGQLVVQPDLAEFVDDDGGFLHRWVVQHMVQHGRLAAAQEPGEQGNRDQLGYAARRAGA